MKQSLIKVNIVILILINNVYKCNVQILQLKLNVLMFKQCLIKINFNYVFGCKNLHSVWNQEQHLI